MNHPQSEYVMAIWR